jgi:cytochrome bd-type quinol oxidase subunit 2
MRLPSFIARALPLVAFFLPAAAHADATQTVAQVAGLFNIFVGLMLTAAILTFATGFGLWCTRIGTWPSYRTEAVKIMEWSVVILFVLVVLLAIVQFFQNHRQVASYILSIIVILFIIWVIVVLASAPKAEKKEEKK